MMTTEENAELGGQNIELTRDVLECIGRLFPKPTDEAVLAVAHLGAFLLAGAARQDSPGATIDPELLARIANLIAGYYEAMAAQSQMLQ